MPKYDKAYFLEKLGKIPESDWGSGSLENHCVLHHLGCTTTPDGKDYTVTEESQALADLLGATRDELWAINDSGNIGRGSSPKQRIMSRIEALS